jgi:Tfp pilus assembly protein PilV
MIEVMVTLIILSVVLLAASASSSMATRLLSTSRRDTDYWAAMSYQAETLLLEGYDRVTSGSGVVDGHAMSWTVTGTDPRIVVLITQRPKGLFEAAQDSIVLFMTGVDP